MHCVYLSLHVITNLDEENALEDSNGGTYPSHGSHSIIENDDEDIMPN